MNRILSFLAASMLLCIAAPSVSAQGGYEVKGVVQDALGPVIGVTLMEHGTTTGTSTGLDGDFVLSVSGPDAINHVNNSAVSSTNQDLIILLMLDRHPELQSREDLWKLVEAYAEGGIEILYDSLYRNEWILDIDDILA